jgi:DNA repair protein RadD
MSDVFTDRPYQTSLFSNVRKAVLSGHKRVLVVLPTGGGKGYITARMMQMAAGKGRNSIFFGAQRELIHQVGKQLERLSVPSNVIMSGVESTYDSFESFAAGARNTIIAKDTLWARAFRSSKIQLPDADVIHIDEAHGSLAKTYQAILASYPDAIVVGWTATPCRADNKPLGSFYTTMVQGATYKELQGEGFLVPVRMIAPDRPDLKGLKSSRGDYARGDLETRMNRDSMVGNLVEEWRKHNQGRQTIVFAAGVAHSIHIQQQFHSIGVASAHIDGTMETAEREDILGRAKDGLIDVITNYGVLHTGVDIPAWKYMICARPTKSFGLWRQMGGRIQRPFEDHDHCFIQDHSDNGIVFGYPDEDVEWEIDGNMDIAKKHNEKKAKESGSKENYPCEKCKTLYRGVRCPNCGHKPERRGEEIAMTKGQLKELERAEANKRATPLEKQAYWDQCLGWAIGTNKVIGAAAHRYRQKYGVWPRNLENVPRASQWGMKGKDFYARVIAPARNDAKRGVEEAQGALF